MGCRQTARAGDLVRFATVDGRVVPDPGARLPGRGAWMHPAKACWDAAVARRAFNRAFRSPVTPSEEAVDFTTAWPKYASTS